MAREIDVNCNLYYYSAKGYGYDKLPECEVRSIIESNRARKTYLNENQTGAVKNRCSSITVTEDFSVRDLHNKALTMFGFSIMPDTCEDEGVISLPELVVFISNSFVISFEDENMKLLNIVERFNLKAVNAGLMIILGSGEIFREGGFKFYIYSHEGNKHNRPHVHVETSDHRRSSIFIDTLEQVANGPLKPKEMKKIKKILKDKKRQLLEAWILLSDGMNVDVNTLLLSE